jgi:glycosyltransferase involved in cell wall biosynthesis
MVGLEALAAGLPCVVPDGSYGSAELERVLHPADVSDPERLAGLLREVARERGSRASLLPAELTLERCAASYLAAFGDLAAAP